jgi:hypothetical protein
MADRRNGNGSGLHLAVSGHQLLDRSKRTAPELGSNGVGASHVRIHNSYQSDRFPLLRQLVIDASVIAAESARTNHRDVDKTVSQLILRIFFAH